MEDKYYWEFISARSYNHALYLAAVCSGFLIGFFAAFIILSKLS